MEILDTLFIIFGFFIVPTILVIVLLFTKMLFMLKDSDNDHDNDNGDGGMKHKPDYPRGGDAEYSNEILEKLV